MRSATDLVPLAGVVLGSGLGPALGDALDETASFSFTDLPVPAPGVPGHAGRLVLGHLAGVPVAAFFGRVHFHEGHGMDVPALLPRLSKELGADTMVLTAAVGGLVRGEAAGTVVILRDHLNMMGVAPLRGWRYPDSMPAFISTDGVYDEALRDLAFGAGSSARDLVIDRCVRGDERAGLRDPDGSRDAAGSRGDGRRHVDGSRSAAGSRS